MRPPPSRPPGRRLLGTLAVLAVVCAAAGVTLLATAEGSVAGGQTAEAEVLGSTLVGVAVMAVAAVALLRTPRR